MFLSTAMERPWVTRKEDGTPRLTCDMCKIFSREVDTARVKRVSASLDFSRCAAQGWYCTDIPLDPEGSFSVHWRDVSLTLPPPPFFFGP